MIGVCGEALIDFTPITVGVDSAFEARVGGSPCNVAVGLARLGTPAAFISKISSDSFGKLIHDHLALNEVDLRWLGRGSEPTALAFVIPDDQGGHDFAFYGSNTAEQSHTLADIPEELPAEVTALHFGSYSLMLGSSALTYEHLMRRESPNRVISLDPNVRPALFPHRERYRRRIESLLPLADLVKASDDDLAWLYPGERIAEVALRWLEAGPSLVTVTKGSDGAIGMTRNTAVSSPGVPVDVADTVGAGDAFMSALLARLDDRGLLYRHALATLTEEAIADTLAYANRAAAITCARRGANPPTSHQIEHFSPLAP